MSSVELGDFFELDGYFAHVATARHHGAWLSWAEFKLDLEYGDGCIQVPVYRHRVRDAFVSRELAVNAGLEYAHQTIETGTVAVWKPPSRLSGH